MQSGLDGFDKSRFVMTFLTILRDTVILCSFKVVLEGKTGKDIPESANNFTLSDVDAIPLGHWIEEV